MCFSIRLFWVTIFVYILILFFFVFCSILINGKAVDKRNNVSLVCFLPSIFKNSLRFTFSFSLLRLWYNINIVIRLLCVDQDHGPQFPTDITKFLKYGTNIIQALGYFSGKQILLAQIGCVHLLAQFALCSVFCIWSTIYMMVNLKYRKLYHSSSFYKQDGFR